MPKSNDKKPQFKDWKKFKLLDGTSRWLPDWADKPLHYAAKPEEVLAEVMKVKVPKDWRKVIPTGRRTRR